MTRTDPSKMITSCDECRFISTLDHFDGASCTLCGCDSVTVTKKFQLEPFDTDKS